MHELRKQMISVLKVFDMLNQRNMTINVYTDNNHDEQHLTHFAYVYYAGIELKKCYKAIVKSKYRFFDETADLNIEFSAYKSNENKIVLKKDKMLSHKLLQVIFYFNDYEKISNAFDLYIKWSNSRKIVKCDKPIELEMTVPPDDPSNPNYKTHMKKWFKFCEENPKWIQKLKNECI